MMRVHVVQDLNIRSVTASNTRTLLGCDIVEILTQPMTIQEQQLEAIAVQIRNCRICKKQKIGIAVPGEGNANADVVFVGEAPGKQEAVTGRPFIGRAGTLLRELIAQVGLKEDEVFITSAVKYLPEYTTPTLEDIEHGRTHLFAQLDVINPKIIVLLGNVATIALLEKKVAISKMHGTVVEKDGRRYLIAYHPAAPLYSPKVKAEIIKDFKKLQSLIKA